ncbi:MAG TPA: SCO family protein [Vicinamibacterales bacterium]|nr:SCO family protein [Vicinamibacterales bacterium]
MRRLAVVLVGLGLALPACSRGRSYELRGQVLAVDASRGELTVRHEDIHGFMPGMTMPFKVRPASITAQRQPGDLISATLVVEDGLPYLTGVTLLGRAAVVDAPPSRAPFDLLAAGDPVPDTPFVDQSGTARRLSDWRGRVVAVTFTYTRCPLPDFCPLMDRSFAVVQRTVVDDPALRHRVHLVSITLDPGYDTPPVLAGHAARLGADAGVWTFLTAPPSDLDAFAARFGVSVTRAEDGRADLVHNLRTAVVDTGGRIAAMLTGHAWTPSELTAAIRDTNATR